jgi:hypothetical protein
MNQMGWEVSWKRRHEQGTFIYQTDSERVQDKKQEQLLLLAMIEDLVRYEIALREQGADGSYLVFPFQSIRQARDQHDPDSNKVTFRFEGPVLNIYATLAVRLSHSDLFTKKELWRDAITYTSTVGGTYGLEFNNIGEGLAELTLFFDEKSEEVTCFHFEEYVKVHLQRRALPNTIIRRRIFVCPKCKTPISDLQAKRRRELNFDWIRCNVCDTKISLLDREERLPLQPLPPSRVPEMDDAANKKRDHDAAQLKLQGKIVTGDFDVFLCHNFEDKPQVKEIGEKLKEHGILPWLDEWELPPGRPWQPLLEKQIGKIKSAAVFVGKRGIGPWQHQELDAFLREFVRRGCPVIPVILDCAPEEPQLPIFLQGITWVDFREKVPDPMERLRWGISGERGSAL